MNIIMNLSQGELLQLVKSGDDDACDDACAELLRRYAPLIASIVRSTLIVLPGATRSDSDELRQEAAIKLYQAALSYDAEKSGVSFGLYAKICIKNRMISLIRKRRSELGVVGKSESAYEELMLSDVGENDPSSAVLERERESELLLRIKSALSPLEHDVFLMYKDGKKSSEIAESLKIKTKTAENAIYRMKIKIAKLL